MACTAQRARMHGTARTAGTRTARMHGTYTHSTARHARTACTCMHGTHTHSAHACMHGTARTRTACRREARAGGKGNTQKRNERKSKSWIDWDQARFRSRWSRHTNAMGRRLRGGRKGRSARHMPIRVVPRLSPPRRAAPRLVDLVGGGGGLRHILSLSLSQTIRSPCPSAHAHVTTRPTPTPLHLKHATRPSPQTLPNAHIQSCPLFLRSTQRGSGYLVRGRGPAAFLLPASPRPFCLLTFMTSPPNAGAGGRGGRGVCRASRAVVAGPADEAMEEAFDRVCVRGWVAWPRGVSVTCDAAGRRHHEKRGGQDLWAAVHPAPATTAQRALVANRGPGDSERPIHRKCARVGMRGSAWPWWAGPRPMRLRLLLLA